ncbi:MAG: ATP-binding protein [Saprospiraceae bacterium]
MKKLPIGIQTFDKIIEEDFLYIDKTQKIHQLITSGDYFFLSRPRRFGKSLTISTIKAIYDGKASLFRGLWIADKWNWNKKNPVIHIPFNEIGYKSLGLAEALNRFLDEQADLYSIKLEASVYDQKFRELIRKLSVKEKVVILIDEYDKAIIDYLGTETAQALTHQQILKNFYSIIKSSDPYIELLLITGVSKFSKIGIFSDLNNLNDITFDWRFAELTGYTQKELEFYFEPYFQMVLDRNNFTELTELLSQVRYWYNGYSWDAECFVYNPFSVLSYFATGEFRNYWFETGTPSFLLELMKAENKYQLSKLKVNQAAFSSYDIENLKALPILFQTGYLTIKQKLPYRYVLDYPNNEVRESMLQYILADLSNDDPGLTTNFILNLQEAFYEDDLDQVMELLQSIFARIPHQIFIANKEAYYHSLLYIVFHFLKLYTVAAEVSTNKGRIDAVIETPRHIYIIEFKLNESAAVALTQIKENGYPEQYASRKKPIVLVGINFAEEKRGIQDWIVERI